VRHRQQHESSRTGGFMLVLHRLHVLHELYVCNGVNGAAEATKLNTWLELGNRAYEVMSNEHAPPISHRIRIVKHGWETVSMA
jgi:hypothetical protein